MALAGLWVQSVKLPDKPDKAQAWHDAADGSYVPSLGAPQPKLDVLGCRTEIIVCAQKDKVVFKTELYEHGVDCSNLDTVTPASVADFGSFYVVCPETKLARSDSK